MTMHEAFYTRDDVNRLYVSRKEEGRALANIQKSVHASIKKIVEYIKNAEEDWLSYLPTPPLGQDMIQRSIF